jgi:hypothetical protein
LAQAFLGPDPAVVKESERYLLKSQAFLEHDDALEVLNAANALLQRMCGLLNLYANYVGEIRVESATWVDFAGRRGGIGATAIGSLNIVSREGLDHLCKELQAGETRATSLFRQAEAHPTFRALLEVAGPRDLSWPDLYILFELLKAASGGPKPLAKLGGVSGKALDRFRLAANDFRHAANARGHGSVRMSKNDAILLIRKLAQAWINSVLQ